MDALIINSYGQIRSRGSHSNTPNNVERTDHISVSFRNVNKLASIINIHIHVYLKWHKNVDSEHKNIVYNLT